MKEFDIENTWTKNDKKATDYYDYIKPDIINKSKKKSTSILNRLKRIIFLEWSINIISLPFILWIIRNDKHFYSIIILVLIIYIIIWLPYQKLLKKINETSNKNISESIAFYIYLLNRFIKQLKFIIWFIMPLGLLIGIFSGLHNKYHSITMIPINLKLSIILITITISGILITITNKLIIPMLYGKSKKRFEELLKQLNNNTN